MWLSGWGGGVRSWYQGPNKMTIDVARMYNPNNHTAQSFRNACRIWLGDPIDKLGQVEPGSIVSIYREWPGNRELLPNKSLLYEAW